ncbi:MAG: pyruvate dehydrogenase [Proteobacteria bacterium]|nr:pyruvate dehydrogenase [Pseudomonadota bacterium]
MKRGTSSAPALSAAPDASFDWRKVASLVLASRALDRIEETELMPARKVLYQFTARGHDVPQVILGSLLDHPHDAVGAYYRSRPMLLTLGLTLADAFAGPMGKSGGFSDGRDIGVVCNLPSRGAASVIPMSGDVGSQYTPAAGWAQSILYRKSVLEEKKYANAISVVMGGDGSVATNGFWAALTIATTQKLPMLFYIEDNGYGISVPSTFQTPGGNIAENLAAFRNLTILDGDGCDVRKAVPLIKEAVALTRSWQGPVMLRLTVPRLSGHSGQDTQAYKPKDLVERENARDPLISLKNHLVPALFSEKEWQALEAEVEGDVAKALAEAEARPAPSPEAIHSGVYFGPGTHGTTTPQTVGGMAAEGISMPEGSESADTEGARINVVAAVRKTLETELALNPRVVVFGEDVGPKGGVHAVTNGLQDKFGAERVFDTSLSEEGIIGRAVGMALAGLVPVPEIQFRKYADPATEQLNNCGTMRWRTNNAFAAPIIVRMPGGFAKCGDPWHSVCGEVQWAHGIGWQVCFPSNAADAVGLLRTALRGNNPVIFFEHRAVLDAAWSRRPYPGDTFTVPFGKASKLSEGDGVTVVTWGAMVERCEEASRSYPGRVELLDLRTIMPWDKAAVLESVAKTRKCLIVHEDGVTAGFGAEISATLAEEALYSLDAPIKRVAVRDVPIPYNVGLMDAVVPNVARIAAAIDELLTA